MVQTVCEIVKDYDKLLEEMPFMPSSSYGRGMLRKDGGPNKIFLTYQFCDQAIAIQFLKDVGFLRVRCSATAVAEMLPGPHNHIHVFLKDWSGDVEGRLLGSGVLSRGP